MEIAIGQWATPRVYIFSGEREIVIEGCGKGTVVVYDIMGRIIHYGSTEKHVQVPATGVYMVKAGDHAAQKIVVR